MFLNGDRWTTSETPCEQAITPTQPQPNEIVVLLKKKLKRDAMLPQIVQMIKAGKSCKAVATALSISTEAVSIAIAVHRAARRPPARIDDKSRHKPTVPFVAKYKAIAAEAQSAQGRRGLRANSPRDESQHAHDPSGPCVCHADASRSADAHSEAEVSVAVGRKPWGAHSHRKWCR